MKPVLWAKKVEEEEESQKSGHLTIFNFLFIKTYLKP